MDRREFISLTTKCTALSLLGTNIINNKLFGAYNPNNNLNIENVLTKFQNASTKVYVKGKEVKIHRICTGRVAVKTNFLSKKGFGEIARLNILLDHDFTDFLPIWVWIIEHPDGIIAIDTGEISEINNLKKYLANESTYNRFVFEKVTKFDITEQDELNFQLDKLGIKIEDIKLVVLTHLHLDHTDGLKFFPKSEILVNDYEFKKPYTNMPSTYPKWFNPNKIIYQPNTIDVFDFAYPINNDLYYIPTPGHTHGHSSIIFKTDEFDIMFAGDASYNQEQVIKGELAGVNANYKKSKETYSKILTYAKSKKLVYLPTHDPNSGWRLDNKIFLTE